VLPSIDPLIHFGDLNNCGGRELFGLDFSPVLSPKMQDFIFHTKREMKLAYPSRAWLLLARRQSRQWFWFERATSSPNKKFC